MTDTIRDKRTSEAVGSTVEMTIGGRTSILLCPGQGAQALGMGRRWAESSAAARAVFDEADAVLGDTLGAPLSRICFDGPVDRIKGTDVSQPALYTCAVASYHGLCEGDWADDGEPAIGGAAGLSLGEYTALHLAGAFDFAAGLELVTRRGALMQQAAEASESGMVALVGADEALAQKVCELAAKGDVLVAANFNAPGQIVLSGTRAACDRAVDAAPEVGLRAKPLPVAGAFHSPLMQSAADAMGEALEAADIRPPKATVWSNVTGEPHVQDDLELLRRRLVEQIVMPVRWDQICEAMPTSDRIEYHELAPGKVLRGLMRRIVRAREVTSHDEP